MKRTSMIFSLLALLASFAPEPLGAGNCKDCVFDTCTMVGGGFGWRSCTEEVRLRCIASIVVNGEAVCLYWIQVGAGCKLSNACIDAY